MKTTYHILFFILVVLILQGCSFFQRLELHNDTDQNWYIQYVLRGQGGVFENNVNIQGKGERKNTAIHFETDTIEFSIAPGEIMVLGWARNITYDTYKNHDCRADGSYLNRCLNVGSLSFKKGSTTYTKSAKKLEDYLSKNNTRRARISLAKLTKKGIPNTP